MLPNAIQRLYTILSLLIVVAMGFIFKFYTGPSHQWFNNYRAAVFYRDFLVLVSVLADKESRSGDGDSFMGLWHHLWARIPQLWHPSLEQFHLLGRILVVLPFLGGIFLIMCWAVFWVGSGYNKLRKNFFKPQRRREYRGREETGFDAGSS